MVQWLAYCGRLEASKSKLTLGEAGLEPGPLNTQINAQVTELWVFKGHIPLFSVSESKISCHGL